MIAGALAIVLLGGGLFGMVLAVGLPPAWPRLWLIAGALWAMAKGGIWLLERPAASTPRQVAFLFAWVGMDARRFVTAPAPAPRPAEWLGATGMLALGAGCAWLALQDPRAPHAVWLAAAGFILSAHCGLFRLLALAWRQAGVDAQPLMDQPLFAVSLGAFWGRRWNRAVPDLLGPLLMQPLRRRPRLALLLCFAASGLIHEAAISLPAGGGYGLPIAYFLLQGLGVLLERSWRRAPTVLRRAATLAIVALPLPLILHESFVQRVWRPFLVDCAQVLQGVLP